jgi:hypothetical protein
MPTVKTAISIDKDVFNEVISITKKLQISKSSFFSQAAQYMIHRKKNLELLGKINSAYEKMPETEDERIYKTASKRYRLRRTIERWK